MTLALEMLVIQDGPEVYLSSVGVMFEDGVAQLSHGQPDHGARLLSSLAERLSCSLRFCIAAEVNQGARRELPWLPGHTPLWQGLEPVSFGMPSGRTLDCLKVNAPSDTARDALGAQRGWTARVGLRMMKSHPLRWFTELEDL